MLTSPSPGTPMVVPSVLPADLSRLGAECRALADADVDRIQWDVMDGRFVPNLTFGPDVIASCRQQVDVPFEAHLMVVEPELLLSRYLDAGCETIIVHAEACTHLHRTLREIRRLGARSGVALNPHTPADVVAHVLDEVDEIVVMTVNPGFGGQSYIRQMEPKIARVRDLIDASGNDIDLEVDGGITSVTVDGAARAGANMFVSGSWLFQHPEGRAAAAAELRARAAAVAPRLRSGVPAGHA